jgi:hypothetical protein
MLKRRDLAICLSAELSNAPLLGLIDAAGLPRNWENLSRKALAFLRLAFNPPHAQKTLQSGLKSSDRILQIG